MPDECVTAGRTKGRSWKMRAGMLLVGVCAVGFCLAARHWMLGESASADPVTRPAARQAAARPQPSRARHQAPRASRPASAKPATAPSAVTDVAVVNGDRVHREELARECLRHYGEEVLVSIVNKYLIHMECQEKKISVSQDEVNAEIRQMAEQYRISVEHWLKMLKQERGLSSQQYANDIVWPMLALRKLAGSRLEVTKQELDEQFERQYGEAVCARLIVCDDRKSAQEVRAAAIANPDTFGELAKEKSIDGHSASMNGVVPPIRRHTGPKEIEQAAFEMADGEVSEVIPVGAQYLVLKRDRLQPAVKVAAEQVKVGMIDVIRDRKMRTVADEIFRELQDKAEVRNVLNHPELSRQMPGVAAVVNGQQITNRELAEVCIERHGEEVLEGMINRCLLEQACRANEITITEADLDEEIARAAERVLPVKPGGAPDVERWLELVTKKQKVSVDVYRRDAVWPSVALRKLVVDDVKVAEEDLDRGYEANYGPRVRCLAIQFDDLRRAQRVWALARDNPTEEYFGDLAAEYSVDPRGRALRGEMPPVQKHGGEQLLEKEAFELKRGELSGIILVGNSRYVILLCLGRTEPVAVDFASVREMIYDDIFEKKLHVAMSETFRKIQERAHIVNSLAGVVRAPKKPAFLREAGG